MSTMQFRNASEHVLKLGSVGLPDVQPGEIVEVPIVLCAPKLNASGGRGKSAIERVAPQLVPVDPDESKAWQEAPKPLPPKSLVVSVAGRAPGEPAGVAQVRELQRLAREKKAAAEALKSAGEAKK